MQRTYTIGHPSEDVLERFLLHQCAEEELENLETHVIGCESCVTRLEQLEIEVAAMKTALQELRIEAAAREVAKRDRARSRWFSMPALSFAGGLAAIALAVGIAPQLLHHAAATDVNLIAYRGSENPTVPLGRPLNLHLNAADLNEGRVTVEVVDQSGKRVWEGSSEVKHAEVNLATPAVQQTGSFFIRVYEPAGSNPEGDLLREFPVQVK
jgi:hypothetical protein